MGAGATVAANEFRGRAPNRRDRIRLIFPGEGRSGFLGKDCVCCERDEHDEGKDSPAGKEGGHDDYYILIGAMINF